jgi:hypothetical protein
VTTKCFRSSRQAFTLPVLLSAEGKKPRQGPQLPFLNDFSADDVSLSMKDHRQQYCNLKFVKPIRKHSKSF